jgi:hypothetical protein
MLGLFFIILVQVYCKDSVSSDEGEPFLFLGAFSKLNKICGGTDVKTPRINFVMTVTGGRCCFKGTDVFAEHLSCQGYLQKHTNKLHGYKNSNAKQQKFLLKNICNWAYMSKKRKTVT